MTIYSTKMKTEKTKKGAAFERIDKKERKSERMAPLLLVYKLHLVDVQMFDKLIIVSKFYVSQSKV